MHFWTSSSVNASASPFPSERNRGSFPSNDSSSASCAAPSMDRKDVSVACSWPMRARLNASGSQRNAPGMRILCTNCSAASTPEQPPVLGGGVGNPKSTVTASSVQTTSTMINRSTQKSSTCSRDQGSNAPPSCKVRAPTAAAPSAHRIASSESRPPAMVRRNAPRWASWGSALTMIRAPFASFCARTPNARAASASSAPATSANDRGTSGASATSDRSMRFSGMRSSSSGSTGSVAAAAATASSFSAEMSTGVPSANVAGEHAMSADGRAASGSPKSTTCAMRSFATSLTSSNPSVATACNVAACAVSGSMNVWSHATVSMRCVSCSPCANWSPMAASCSESVTSAAPNRSNSDCVRPNAPIRRVSRTAAATASSHLPASPFMSSEQTAQASRAESKCWNSTKENSGSVRVMTFNRTCSADSTMRLAVAARCSASVVMASTGRLAKRWKLNCCKSSCWKTCARTGTPVAGCGTAGTSSGSK
mmetsp:Transcript_34510/g.106684  ORF Transcript_34510/g.106684 Transcript_34510/m.106684 type:complete len:482 (+) Transcript_34510:974-2419(+)